MEEGKEGDASHDECRGKLFIDGNGRTKGEDRKGDGNLNGEKRDPYDTEDTADKHKADKGEGNGPDCASAHLGAEYSDTQHRQQVIRSKHWMGEAAGESQCAMTGVGKEGCGQKAKEEKE